MAVIHKSIRLSEGYFLSPIDSVKLIVRAWPLIQYWVSKIDIEILLATFK